MTFNPNVLPADLPVPVDDGACQHLIGQRLPDITLNATHGAPVHLASMAGWLVIYCYPMTGRPNVALPDGWDSIPSARGCTPQSCGFRDHHAELTALNTKVFGLSTQTTAHQQEAAARLHLPFALLSDHDLRWTQALQLPTFEVDGVALNKRVTLIAKDGVIQHTFYPVFPPDKNADDVLTWLQQHV